MMLARAGLRSRDAMIRYLFARLVMPLAFAAATLIDSYTLRLLPIPPQFHPRSAVAAAGVFGYFAPGIYIKNMTTKRPNAFSSPCRMDST